MFRVRLLLLLLVLLFLLFFESASCTRTSPASDDPERRIQNTAFSAPAGTLALVHANPVAAPPYQSILTRGPASSSPGTG
jgi:hypothetical protein